MSSAQPTGSSVIAEVAERLAAAEPSDRAKVDLATYKGIREPWNDWIHVVACGRHFAPLLARLALEPRP